MPPNSRLPRQSGPKHTKTARSPSYQRKPPSKPSGPPSARRSAPARIEQFVYPVTLPSFFLPLTVKLGASDDPVSTTDAPSPATPGPLLAYDVAVARLKDLVADSTLTTDQQLLLHSAMIIAQSLVAPGDIHSIVNIITSPSTLASEVLELSHVITAGMRAFIAFPGRSWHTHPIWWILYRVY